MTAGKLGTANLAANTDTTVYTVPADTVSTVNINIVNRGAASTKVRLAITTTTAPGAADYLEYDVLVPTCGVLERTGIVCSAGEKVVLRADTAGISVRVHGFEE